MFELKSKMPRLIFEVGGYAYGGVTMALSIARCIHLERSLIAFAKGCAVLPLRDSGLFETVYDADGSDYPSFLRSVLDNSRIERVCDFGNAFDDTQELCRARGIPWLSLDMQLWRRIPDRLNSFSDGAIEYLFEAYPGIEDDVRKAGIPAHKLPIVPPIVGHLEPNGQRCQTNLVVISLGGGISPFVSPEENRYPELIAHLLDRLIAKLDGSLEFVVAYGQAMAEHLIKNPVQMPAPVVYMQRSEYLRKLAQAELLLAQPSIHTPFEGFVLGVPTLLLPPQNFSQCFHIEQWGRWDLSIPGTSLQELVPGFRLTSKDDEMFGEQTVNLAFASLLENEPLIDKLSKRYAEAIRYTLGEGWQHRIDAQISAVKRLGGSNGTETIRAILLAS